MKKFTSLLIGCTLAVAGVALAQQPEDQQSPTQPQTQAPEKTHKGKGQGKHGGNAARSDATATGQTGAMKEPGGMKEPGARKGRKGKAAATEPATDTNVSGQATTSTEQGSGKHGRKGRMKSETSAGATTDVSAETDTNAMPGGKHQGQHGKGRNAREEKPKMSPSETPATASASAAPSVAATGEENMKGKGKGKGAAKKLEPQKVEQIKSQHANFKAEPKPDKVPPVTFTQNFRIHGSDHWQGKQYEVFRSYHPERHDHGWYHSHYNRVELIGGGYYYFNNGYWFPAWGYNPSVQYYAYNGPIYVGHRALPPDRVIADVQAALQDMGYYRGEVDGLLGPLTREALTNYQADEGLTQTAAIDEPTLDSLGMG